MDEELFNRLFEQHTAGVLNEAEKAQFLAMLNDPVYQEALTGQLYALYQLAAEEAVPEPVITNRIQAAVLQQIRSSVATPKYPSPVVIRLRRYAAAAAVVAATVTGFWFWQGGNRKDKLSKITAADKNVHVPGGNRAVLTLANGQQIVLDSVANGTLAQQPGAQVVKQRSGLLAYKTAGTPSQPGPSPATPSFNTLATPRGGQYQLQLPDGTRVWLNAASSIQYPTAFTGKERRVVVTGEAYFEVAQNAAQPFVVSSHQQEVQVLGTSFNINAYSDEGNIKTTLLDGSVRVTTTDRQQAATLLPGQQAIVAAGNITTTSANIHEVMGWRNGQIFLTSVSVPVVMQQISRWYDVDVVYEAKIPVRRQFNGMIDRSIPLTSLLEALESNNIHTKLEGRTVIVKP